MNFEKFFLVSTYLDLLKHIIFKKFMLILDFNSIILKVFFFEEVVLKVSFKLLFLILVSNYSF